MSCLRPLCVRCLLPVPPRHPPRLPTAVTPAATTITRVGGKPARYLRYLGRVSAGEGPARGRVQRWRHEYGELYERLDDALVALRRRMGSDWLCTLAQPRHCPVLAVQAGALLCRQDRHRYHASLWGRTPSVLDA